VRLPPKPPATAGRKGRLTPGRLLLLLGIPEQPNRRPTLLRHRANAKLSSH
jgi:hypothetical protein